jgi:drug/metabolite transporter (DMT)-like permease
MASDPRALLAMAAGASLISLTGVLVRYAEVPPTIAGMYRMLFGGLMLGALLVMLRRWRPIPARAWWVCLWPAAAFAADLWLWHRSIHAIGPGLATLLANTQVFFMVAAGVLLFGERLTPRFFLGVLLAFAGLVLILGDGWAALSEEARIGVWFGLATGVAYAAYNLGLKRAQSEAAPRAGEIVLFVSTLQCAVLLALAGLVEGASFAIPDARSLLALLALGLIGQCLGWVLIGRALPRLRVATVGLLLLLQPLLAFLLDVVLFDRPTAGHEWLGVGLSLAGIFLAGLRGPAPAPVAPATGPG